MDSRGGGSGAGIDYRGGVHHSNGLRVKVPIGLRLLKEGEGRRGVQGRPCGVRWAVVRGKVGRMRGRSVIGRDELPRDDRAAGRAWGCSTAEGEKHQRGWKDD